MRTMAAETWRQIIDSAFKGGRAVSYVFGNFFAGEAVAIILRQIGGKYCNGIVHLTTFEAIHGFDWHEKITDALEQHKRMIVAARAHISDRGVVFGYVAQAASTP